MKLSLVEVMLVEVATTSPSIDWEMNVNRKPSSKIFIYDTMGWKTAKMCQNNIVVLLQI